MNAHLAMLRADSDEGGAQAVIWGMPKREQPLMQQQSPAPRGLAAPEGAHQLVKLTVVKCARVDAVWERNICIGIQQPE